MSERKTFACPVCGEPIEVTVRWDATLTHGHNGPKGFFTVVGRASGIEHTCKEASRER